MKIYVTESQIPPTDLYSSDAEHQKRGSMPSRNRLWTAVSPKYNHRQITTLSSKYCTQYRPYAKQTGKLRKQVLPLLRPRAKIPKDEDTLLLLPISRGPYLMQEYLLITPKLLPLQRSRIDRTANSNATKLRY